MATATRRQSTSCFPFIQDKSKWPYAHDVEYFDDLPNRQPSLLFAGLAYREPKYIALWRTLPPDPKNRGDHPQLSCRGQTACALG